MLHWHSEQRAAKVIPFAAREANIPKGALSSVLAGLGTPIRVQRNCEVFGEDGKADSFYQVVSGAVRVCKLVSDGRRQITAFYLPGEIFGLDGEETHLFSAEAITECMLLAVGRNAFLSAAVRQPSLAAQVWNLTLAQLSRAQTHMLLLGRKNAQERIVAFLFEMEERLNRDGEVDLAMSRQDIADYLGLTIETVSRTLTQLERSGLIAIPAARRIVFCNRAALDRCNGTMAA